MNECNPHETHNIYPHLNGKQQFRLNKINQIKDYFFAEIKKRELPGKDLANRLLLLTILISHQYFLSATSWYYFYCNICNCYSSTSRNSKCKFQSYISNF